MRALKERLLLKHCSVLIISGLRGYNPNIFPALDCLPFLVVGIPVAFAIFPLCYVFKFDLEINMYHLSGTVTVYVIFLYPALRPFSDASCDLSAPTAHSASPLCMSSAVR